MKKYYLLFLLLSISLKSICQINGLKDVCPLIAEDYWIYLSTQGGKTIKAVITIKNGTFSGGGTTYTEYISGSQPEINVSIKWNDVCTDKAEIYAYTAYEEYKKPIKIYSLNGINPVVKVRPSSPNVSVVGDEILIPDGESGDIIFDTSISLPITFDVPPKLKFILNGKTIQSISNSGSFVFSYGAHDHNNSVILIEPSLGICDSGSKIIKKYTIKRTGDCLTTELKNQTITSSRVISGCNIDIANSTISNNAKVTINAEEKVIIKPSFKAAAGTTVIIRATNTTTATTRNAALEPKSENQTTDIELSLADNQTLLYPNPTDGVLNIKCGEDGCSVKIYSLSGKLVYSNSSMNDGAIIDLSTQPKGMYIARIVMDGQTITEKISLQ